MLLLASSREVLHGHNLYFLMLNKNTSGVKNVRGYATRSSIANRYVRPKTLISVEAKKLLIKNLFHYLNDIQ